MKSKGRGFLCESIQETAKRFLGETISQKELRLYPFIDYCIKNGGFMDSNKIDEDEKIILNCRISEGHIFRLADGQIYPTRKFYDFIQSVLADSYVVFLEDDTNV